MADSPSPTIERLEDQIKWYGSKSRAAQRWYKILKMVQIVLAAAIPLVAVFQLPYPGEIAAVLGSAILALEGMQQLSQYQQNWIAYRSTGEALKHEKFLYLAGAGPYAGAERPSAVLADRIEGLISHEHAKWVSAQEQKAGLDSTRVDIGQQAPASSVADRQSL